MNADAGKQQAPRKKWLFGSLRARINWVGVFIIVMFTVMIFGRILPGIKEGKLEERRGKLRAVVNAVVSNMDHYEQHLRAHSMGWKTETTMPVTLEDAQKSVLRDLREMRYDKTDYFFVLDGSGNVILHPLRPDLEGKNVMDLKGPDGTFVFRELVASSQRDDDAFVSYIWKSKYSETVYEPQTSYARYYWPWNWVVCSGVYTQDITEAAQEASRDAAVYDLGTTSVAMLFLLFVGGAISANEERHKRQLAEARDALWGEMQLAKRIQTALLPHDPAIRGYEISAYLAAADEVGGDYYDVIRAGNRDWLVIGDVSGHGVPAGLVMMMVQTAIRSVLAKDPNIAPSELLRVVNSPIIDNVKLLGENKYVTITVFAVQDDGHFVFAGLHQDILIYRAGTNAVEQVETHGIWLGVNQDISGLVADNDLKMNVGDVMLLFSDGVTEASGPDGQMFSQERLQSALASAGKLPPDKIKADIVAKLGQFKTKDDVTIVVVKRQA
jgi:serine phosphatase RsbU (regulator of sigma subunit)